MSRSNIVDVKHVVKDSTRNKCRLAERTEVKNETGKSNMNEKSSYFNVRHLNVRGNGNSDVNEAMTSSLPSPSFATIQRREFTVSAVYTDTQTGFGQPKKLALPSYAIILIIAGGSVFILAAITTIVCLVRKKSTKKLAQRNSVGSGIYAFLPQNGNLRNKDEEGIGFRYEPSRLLPTVDEDDKYPEQPTHPMSSVDQNRFGSGHPRPVVKIPPNYTPDIQIARHDGTVSTSPRPNQIGSSLPQASGRQNVSFKNDADRRNKTRINTGIPPLDTNVGKQDGNYGGNQGSRYSTAIRNQAYRGHHYSPPNPIIPKPRRSSLAQSSPVSPVSPVSPLSTTSQMPLIQERESYAPPQNRQSRLQRSRGTSRYNRGRYGSAVQSPVSSSSGQAATQRYRTDDYDWKNYHKRGNTNATGRASGDEATHVTTYTATDAIGMREPTSFGDRKDENENDYLTVASPILDNKSTGYLSDEMGHSEVETMR
ncbi:8984_t:CDS:2 [Paraglomus occultum]|uniref:8984_t:CDS:1 n=1 Tax=Paraglomus occultum TaxID=144539 RepID=A0A9N8ZJ36_9GLOM|nr:8984_t:CDS:2 [Paraglomus occultum]